MPTCFAGLMCHAPIVHPEVAGAEAARCRHTTRAMRELAERAVQSAPDRLVLVSPHSPRHRERFSAWTGRHRGDLGRFRAPQLAVDLPDAPEIAAGLHLGPILSDEPLDHGAMVPLSFLWAAGWRGPTAILALPWRQGDEASLGAALGALDGRTAVIASGDMSHRLIPGAPAGYNPQAASFDQAFVQALAADDWAGALAAEPRALAAEDVVASTAFAMGAAGAPLNAELLSYEGPWGVGYCEAVLYDPSPPLYAVARKAIAARVRREAYEPPKSPLPARPVFVTLHKGGALRGCIGHLEVRGERDLNDIVARVAPQSAVEDPRFPPVTAEELSELELEISVLEPPEPARGVEDLDPKKWGVIVSNGWRRGVLLPDIEGVDSAEQQVEIARRKAGIARGEPIELQRFAVRKEVQP